MLRLFFFLSCFLPPKLAWKLAEFVPIKLTLVVSGTPGMTGQNLQWTLFKEFFSIFGCCIYLGKITLPAWIYSSFSNACKEHIKN